MGIGKTNSNAIKKCNLRVIASPSAIIIVEDANGNVICDSKANSLGIAVFTDLKEGVYNISSIDNSSKYYQHQTKIAILKYGQDTIVEFIHVFGITRVNSSNTSSKKPQLASWTRTDNAIGLTFSPSYGKSIGYSNFDLYSPWREMKKEKVDGYDMIKIPRFWYKRKVIGKTETIQIANGPVKGFQIHPLFTAGGDYSKAYIAPYFWPGEHKTTPGNSGSHIYPTQLSTCKSNVKELGTGWRVFDYYALSAIQMLILVEIASYDLIGQIGYGLFFDSASNTNENGEKTEDRIYSGTSDGLIYPTGVNPNGAIKSEYYAPVYRGIEGLWGFGRYAVDGICYNRSNRNYYIYLNPTEYKSDSINKDTSIALSYTCPILTSEGNALSGYAIQLGYDKNYPFIMLPSDSLKNSSCRLDCCSSIVGAESEYETGVTMPIIGGWGNLEAGLFGAFLDRHGNKSITSSFYPFQRVICVKS